MSYSTGNGSQPYWISTAHLNNDEKQDFVLEFKGNDTIEIFFGDGNGNIRRQQICQLSKDSALISIKIISWKLSSPISVSIPSISTIWNCEIEHLIEEKPMHLIMTLVQNDLFLLI